MPKVHDAQEMIQEAIAVSQDEQRQVRGGLRSLEAFELLPGWAIGFLDDVWWCRFALPRLSTWQEHDHLDLTRKDGDEKDGERINSTNVCSKVAGLTYCHVECSRIRL